MPALGIEQATGYDLGCCEKANTQLTTAKATHIAATAM